MDERARALGRQAALGDAEAAERLRALERRLQPDYGLIISGHELDKTRLRKTIKLVAELTGKDEEAVTDLCRASLVTVLKRVTRDAALAAEQRFQALGVQTRLTEK